MKMELELEHEFDEEQGPLALLVDVDFTPGRPAPACSNPDSPAFSDSGDPDEWTIRSVLVKSACPGGHYKQGDLISLTALDDRFDEAVGEAAREQYEERARERAYGEAY